MSIRQDNIQIYVFIMQEQNISVCVEHMGIKIWNSIEIESIN